MARRRTREVPPTVARRLVKKLPKLSPLLREGFRSLWTDAQCDAWAKKLPPRQVLAQAQRWLELLERAGDEAPGTPSRLAWLAELTLHLEDALSGVPHPEAIAARHAHEASALEAQRLRARLHSRMLLLVGGDEARGAAIAIAAQGELTGSLVALAELLSRWRTEARLRLLADELGLEEGLLHRAHGSARLLIEAREHAKPTPHQRTEGRLLRELDALERAMHAARDQGLAVPTLGLHREPAPRGKRRAAKKR